MHAELARVLAALEPELGAATNEPSVLGGGITNQNFRARFGDAEVVVRIAGRDTDLLGIDRAAEHVATQAAAKLGIAPAVLAFLPEHSCLVTEFVAGTPIADQALREPPALPEVARALRAFHEHAPALPARFDAPAIARAYLALARERGAVPPAAWDAARLADRIAAALGDHPEHRQVPCHDDLLGANVLSDGSGSGSSTGSTRDGRPLLRPRQPVGQQRLHRADDRALLRPTGTSRARRAASPRCA